MTKKLLMICAFALSFSGVNVLTPANTSEARSGIFRKIPGKVLKPHKIPELPESRGIPELRGTTEPKNEFCPHRLQENDTDCEAETPDDIKGLSDNPYSGGRDKDFRSREIFLQPKPIGE